MGEARAVFMGAGTLLEFDEISRCTDHGTYARDGGGSGYILNVSCLHSRDNV